MFSNGSQPETGFPRRYKIAADVEFITSATIISSIRIILMERIAFFLYRVGRWGGGLLVYLYLGGIRTL